MTRSAVAPTGVSNGTSVTTAETPTARRTALGTGVPPNIRSPSGLRTCCHPCRRTATGLVFSEDFAEDAPRVRALLVGLAHVMGAGGESLPERPAASTRPRGLADGQPVPERVTAVGGEQRPGDSQVAGRITDAARPEVDDGCQPAI